MLSTGIMLNSAQYGVIFISLVKWFNSAFCTMLYLVRHRYPSIERHCLLWCVMLTGDCVFGLGHASVRSVKVEDHAAVVWGGR